MWLWMDAWEDVMWHGGANHTRHNVPGNMGKLVSMFTSWSASLVSGQFKLCAMSFGVSRSCCRRSMSCQ